MAMQTKEIPGVNKMNVLADKGYHSGEQLEQCQKNDITTFVSPKAPATKDIGLYPITSFVYDKDQYCYICPQGNAMHTNGTWHRHSDNRRSGKSAYSFQRYNTPACKTCKSRPLCTQSKNNGRYIDRSEYAEIIEANARRVESNPDYYRQRQQITEHMFGTLKRQRGFTFALVRKKDNVLGEVGLMFIGYNLSRCVSILGVEHLIKALKECCLPVFMNKLRPFLSRFNGFFIKAVKTIPVSMGEFNVAKTSLFHHDELFLFVN